MSIKTNHQQRNKGDVSPLLLVEDNAARSERRLWEVNGAASASAPIVVRVHRISEKKVELVSETSYKAGLLRHRDGRSSLAFKLLDAARRSSYRSPIVAGAAYGSNRSFITGVFERGYNCIVEVRPSFQILLMPNSRGKLKAARVSKLLNNAVWKRIKVVLPQLGRAVDCRAAELGLHHVTQKHRVRLFAVNLGAIKGFHRGIMIGACTDRTATLPRLIRTLYWVRWIRTVVRRNERSEHITPTLSANGVRKRKREGLVEYRSNITLAQVQDQSRSGARAIRSEHQVVQGFLCRSSSVVNVVELFAGAGGMGLGFLMAGGEDRHFRLVFSGEVHPVYVETLKRNHEYFGVNRQRRPVNRIPESTESIDLTTKRALHQVESAVRAAGSVNVLIGGPPCRGFSSANRNSWASDNPHNDLVNVFLRYVERLKPQVFLMENVQGIVWTATNGNARDRASVAEDVLKRMRKHGYLVFPKLLDAVWYGVPQYRTRFFLLGIHEDVGYRADDFGSWGPFPLPTHGPGCSSQYVTVRDAIGDLPRVGNGQPLERLEYSEPGSAVLRANPFLRVMRRGAPRGSMLDHITSRHAEYVIERYKRIPAGGNWESIAKMMSNYADVQRTHSNIYRRLVWNRPSITIGHYRKSMLVHPQQDRGLSLREASRLQSFPDWFRFSGAVSGDGGLIHKQQQLANAVCPLVTEAIADFILSL
jgi:DNA-cytosine methyltransferase